MSKAHSLGLLKPEGNQLPENRKKGVILVADSTFLITSGSTRGAKDQQGNWHFTDDSVAFSGKSNNEHKYAVDHKPHCLRSINGLPLKNFLSPANISDQKIILVLIEEPVDRYSNKATICLF